MFWEELLDLCSWGGMKRPRWGVVELLKCNGSWPKAYSPSSWSAGHNCEDMSGRPP